jgi:hypothetical protein
MAFLTVRALFGERFSYNATICSAVGYALSAGQELAHNAPGPRKISRYDRNEVRRARFRNPP